MGIDVDCHLFYGVPLAEGDWEFDDDDKGKYIAPAPWAVRDEEGDEVYGDIDAWWEKVHQYQNPFEGWYKRGEGQEGYRRYQQYRDEWYAQHPLHYSIEHDGSYDGDSSQYLVLARTSIEGDWSGPTKVNPSSLVVTEQEQLAFQQFLTEYGVKTADEPGWYLIARLS